MITEDILITSKDLMKWLNREITEDDEELCMYLSNAVKNQYEYHKEIERLNNIIDEYKNLIFKLHNIYMFGDNAQKLNEKEILLQKEIVKELKENKQI